MYIISRRSEAKTYQGLSGRDDMTEKEKCD